VSKRLALSALAALLGACETSSLYLYDREIDYLREDVVDLVAICFQAGENAFVGDSVEPEDVVDPAGPGNGFTATYDLPLDDRVILGRGSGRVAVRIEEDGVPSPDPLNFSFGTTSADTVTVRYELRYEGETAGLRDTDVDLVVSLTGVRGSGGDFGCFYRVEGDMYLGNTRCRDLFLEFFADGRPRDGIVAREGYGRGEVDDPGVFDVFEMNLHWYEEVFVADGDVGGCCAYFDEEFHYGDVF